MLDVALAILHQEATQADFLIAMNHGEPHCVEDLMAIATVTEIESQEPDDPLVMFSAFQFINQNWGGDG